MPLGLGHDEKTVSVESLNRPCWLCGKQKHPTHLQFFFAIFLGCQERYIFVDVHGIVYSWCFKAFWQPFSHQSNKHTYHEIRHDFPIVEVNDFKDSAVSLLVNDAGEFSVNGSAA